MGRWYAGYYPEAEAAFRRRAWQKYKPRRALGIDGMRALDTKIRLGRLGLRWSAETRVLDAGCGAGGFLAGLRHETGAQVRGVDFNPECQAFAAEVYRLPVDTGELKAQAYPDAAFDLVTTWHCLEHTYDPAAELAEHLRITRPGGFLVVEVPTPSPLAWLFRGRWFFLQAPTHLYHLRPRALRALMEQAGWRVRQVRRPWLPSELAGSLLMLFGIRRFVPGVMYGKGVAARLVQALFGLLLLIDVPVTLLLALGAATGGLRLIGQRPEDAA
ncbi:MAG: class I SAM-dependent methyltransferase [bacterium]